MVVNQPVQQRSWKTQKQHKEHSPGPYDKRNPVSLEEAAAIKKRVDTDLADLVKEQAGRESRASSTTEARIGTRPPYTFEKKQQWTPDEERGSKTTPTVTPYNCLL